MHERKQDCEVNYQGTRCELRSSVPRVLWHDDAAFYRPGRVLRIVSMYTVFNPLSPCEGTSSLDLTKNSNFLFLQFAYNITIIT